MAVYRHRKQFLEDNYNYTLEVDFHLDSFKELIKITEETIDKEIKREILEYEKLINEAQENEPDFYYDYVDHIIKINTNQLFYNSLLISLYSFLEKKLYQFSKLAEPNYILKINDLSGEGVFKYQKYLKKIVGIDFDKLNTEWAEITKYNKLRNILVHSPSKEIENNEYNQKLIITLKSIDGLNFKESNDSIQFQILDKKILLNFTATIQNLLHEIYYEKE